MAQICVILKLKIVLFRYVNYIRNSKAITLLGKRIKNLREEQGISQSQLAFESEIPRNQVGRIERGEINTSISTLFAISKALNISITELVKIEGY